MAKAKKEPFVEVAELEPLTRANVDKYCGAAANVVTELRELLFQHYYDLHHNKDGTQPTKAADDPTYAARIHRMMTACDGFCNAVRGVH
jgi:hypothetical protein